MSPAKYKDCKVKWYYTIYRGKPPCLEVSLDIKRLPNVSAVNYRRLIWGQENTNMDTPIPVLTTPYTVEYNGQAIFTLTSRKWQVIATRNTLMYEKG